MNVLVWVGLGLAVLWALRQLFPSNSKQVKNIRRNAGRPINGRPDITWILAGLVISAAIIWVAFLALRNSR